MNENKIRIMMSNICSALEPKTIGSKIVDWIGFSAVLFEAMKTYDFGTCRVPGQGFIEFPDAVDFVSAGVGPRSSIPSHYVVRIHRDRADVYLKRGLAAKATGCAVVIYTVDAYVSDPDMTDDERKRVVENAPTHVIVAVLAYAGPTAPLPPYRLVWNLAGGNFEAGTWSLEEIRQKAEAAIEYDKAWVTVAD